MKCKKKVENDQKKCFDQLLDEGSTQKLVKINNSGHVFGRSIKSCLVREQVDKAVFDVVKKASSRCDNIKLCKSRYYAKTVGPSNRNIRKTIVYLTKFHNVDFEFA